MQTATFIRLLANVGAADDDDVLGQMPELPSLGKRWTVRRKAAVIEAVRGGWIPIEEACRLYKLSVDEFLAWERDSDRRSVFTACAARALKHTLILKRRGGRSDMDHARTLTERLALTMLGATGSRPSGNSTKAGIRRRGLYLWDSRRREEAWMRAKRAHALT